MLIYAALCNEFLAKTNTLHVFYATRIHEKQSLALLNTNSLFIPSLARFFKYLMFFFKFTDLVTGFDIRCFHCEYTVQTKFNSI